jgi:hypothetical protein
MTSGRHAAPRTPKPRSEVITAAFLAAGSWAVLGLGIALRVWGEYAIGAGGLAVVAIWVVFG